MQESFCFLLFFIHTLMATSRNSDERNTTTSYLPYRFPSRVMVKLKGPNETRKKDGGPYYAQGKQHNAACAPLLTILCQFHTKMCCIKLNKRMLWPYRHM